MIIVSVTMTVKLFASRFFFQDTFQCMPLCALVGERILCMHGGISPELKSLQQLRQIPRPCDASTPSLEMDLLWADPVVGLTGFQANMRGASYGFGPDVLATMCKTLNIDLVGCQILAINHVSFAKFAVMQR